MHRICGWLSQELIRRSGSSSHVAIWSGRGFADSVRAVARGHVDIALVTPAAFARAALEGNGVYDGDVYPELCALAVIPQRDRLVVAVHRTLGASSFSALRDTRPPLTVATGLQDGVHHVGMAAHALLDRAGIDVLGWGGQFLADERPFESFDHIRSGRANAIVQEAIMLPHWQQFGSDYHFLEVEADVLSGLEAEFGWPPAQIPHGYFPDQAAFQTLDFSDFLVLTRRDLPDDIAYAAAWVFGETRDVLERQYRHLPPGRSPITYPLDPHLMGRTPLPLHPGAARYYVALGRVGN